MPPKQVYGKQSKTAAAGYSKFLSPDKEEDLTRTAQNRGAKKKLGHGKDVKRDVKQFPETRNKDDATDGDNLFAEEELEAPRPNPQKCNMRVKRDDSPSLEFQLEGLTLEDKIEPIQQFKNRKGRSRKELTGRDACSDTRSRRTRIREKPKETSDNESKDESLKTESNCSQVVEPKGVHLAQPKIHSPTAESNPVEPIKPQRNVRQVEVTTAPIRRRKPKEHVELHHQGLEPSLCSDNIYTTHVKPLLNLSDRARIIPFDEWSAEIDSVVEVTKIAEASFSEVYRLSVTSALSDCLDESVLKIVALKTPPYAPLPSECTTNGRTRRKDDMERQLQKEREQREEQDGWKSRVEDVVSEVRLLQNLNYIPGFTDFRELTILQGRPSAVFGRAWREWNKTRPRGKKSEFPDPNKKASYDDNQLWVVIEMQDAGTDCGKLMEAGGINTIWEIWDVFWGVCLSVAKAEEACRFEHRDLHMDNICIRSLEPNDCSTQPVVNNPLKRKLGFTRLETTVIDYTLSRADIIHTSSPRRNASSPSTPSHNSMISMSSSSSDSTCQRDVAYLDLNKDPSLFEGYASEEYQYEIYRYMRDAVHLSDNSITPSHSSEDVPAYTSETPRRSPRKLTSAPEEPRSQDPWRAFHPKTNLIWAHFVLHKLLLGIRGNEPASLSDAAVIQNVDVDEALAPRVWKKAVTLHRILDKVASMLEPRTLRTQGSLGSVKELVVLAMEARWLGVGDVSGETVSAKQHQEPSA